MNRHLKGWMVFLILLMFTPTTTFSYGWGYKANKNNEKPDIGMYEQLIEGHLAFYMDETEEKNLYLTFDNGYEEGYTEGILHILNKHKIPATFFVTGHYVKSEPSLIKQMIQDGHIIGNHSYHHPDFTTFTKEEMAKDLHKLEEAVREIAPNYKMNYMRPPRGTFNKDTLTWSDELGYIQMFWSVAFKDWDRHQKRGWEYAYNQVVDQIHPGAIILMHTVSEDNAAALEKIIVELKKQGYTFKSLDYLLLKQLQVTDFFF